MVKISIIDSSISSVENWGVLWFIGAGIAAVITLFMMLNRRAKIRRIPEDHPARDDVRLPTALIATLTWFGLTLAITTGIIMLKIGLTSPTYLYEGTVTSVSEPLEFSGGSALIVTLEGHEHPLHVRYPDFAQEAIQGLDGQEARFVCIEEHRRYGQDPLVCDAAADQPNGAFEDLEK